MNALQTIASVATYAFSFKLPVKDTKVDQHKLASIITKALKMNLSEGEIESFMSSDLVVDVVKSVSRHNAPAEINVTVSNLQGRVIYTTFQN